MTAQVFAALLIGLGFGALALIAQRRARHQLWQRLLQEIAAAERGGAVQQEPLPADPLAASAIAQVRQLTALLGRTDADLRAERDRLAAVLDALSDGVLAVDSAGRVLLANPAACHVLGLSDPPVGRKLIDLLRLPPILEAWQRLQATKEGQEPAEVTLTDGREVVVAVRPLTSTGALPGAALAPMGAVLVLRDVTSLRRLERVRRDFIANASHELKTPVATIRAAGELLVDGALDDRDDAQQFAETIVRNAERLSAILADLLDLSRMEAGAYDLKTTGVVVLPRLQRAAELLETQTKARSQTVLIEAPANLRCRANAAALDQVLQNLLDNASKYSGSGSTIWLRAAEEGVRVVLVVADNGPGIPLQHRQRIFERFYRLDSGRSRELGGTGLGLAIVKHLTEGMGGRIRCAANQPRGTQFVVDLAAASATPT